MVFGRDRAPSASFTRGSGALASHPGSRGRSSGRPFRSCPYKTSFLGPIGLCPPSTCVLRKVLSSEALGSDSHSCPVRLRVGHGRARICPPRQPGYPFLYHAQREEGEKTCLRHWPRSPPQPPLLPPSPAVRSPESRPRSQVYVHVSVLLRGIGSDFSRILGRGGNQPSLRVASLEICEIPFHFPLLERVATLEWHAIS